jgi:glycosyltransferase involved in cell wall biosynthesis
MLVVNLSFLLSKPTGISTYALNLFPHLQELNPTLLTWQNFDNFNCHSIPNDLTAERGTKGHLRRLFWTQFKLPDIYRKLKGSLLFSPVPEAPLATNCPYVVTVHDLIPLRFYRRFSPLSNYFRYQLPLVLEQAQHIICNSQSTAGDLHSFLGLAEEKITSIPLAYDSNNFRFLNLEQPENPYYLYLGRHDPYKNLQGLIRAFSRMNKGNDAHLWIAGQPDGRYTPKLEMMVTELGLKNRVKFLDYVPYHQLPIIINQALALVFPTFWEGFGIPVLEAMGCGTPVITSNLSSLPEIVGNAGILIDPHRTEEIAAAMGAIMEDSGLRSHLSRLSLQRASQFSWQKTGKATVKVLEKYL